MLATIILDNFGLLGFPVAPASAGRIVGAMLLVVGVYLVQRF